MFLIFDFCIRMVIMRLFFKYKSSLSFLRQKYAIFNLPLRIKLIIQSVLHSWITCLKNISVKILKLNKFSSISEFK